jgi:hypothetical protein
VLSRGNIGQSLRCAEQCARSMMRSRYTSLEYCVGNWRTRRTSKRGRACGGWMMKRRKYSWRARGHSDDDSARWRLGCGGCTHIVLEVWVCARSNEVSHNLHVEPSGARGPVKRSVSVLQQKKEKKKSRIGIGESEFKVRKETRRPCCQQKW